MKVIEKKLNHLNTFIAFSPPNQLRSEQVIHRLGRVGLRNSPDATQD